MNAQEYFDTHGINADSIEKFGITYDAEKITIPIKDQNGNLLYSKYRLLNGEVKYKFDHGSHPTLFNLPAIQNSKYVIITEGEMDTIKLSQENITAISSTAGAQTFKEEWAKLLEGKQVYICYDSDEPGQKATQKLVDKLSTVKVIELPTDTKDVCEYFQKYSRDDFKKLVKQAIPKEQYLKDHAPTDYQIIPFSDILNMNFPPEEWIVDKIIPSEGFTMFVGESGSGKSFIALEAVRAISTYHSEINPEPLFLGNFSVKQGVPILIIDKENGLRRLKKRAQGLGIIQGGGIYSLAYPEKFSLDNQEFIDSVKNFITDKGIRLVIIDSFVDFELGSEIDPVEISKVFDSFRSLGLNLSYILLHHDSKPVPRFNVPVSRRTRGSTNIIAQLDNMFYLEKTKSPNIINIEQGKSRDNEPVNKFAIQFVSDENGNMTSFKYLGQVNDQVRMIEDAQNWLYSFLENNSYAAKDEIIASGQSLGFTPRIFNDVIPQMEQKGIIDFIKKPGSGNKRYYFLVKGGDTNEPSN